MRRWSTTAPILAALALLTAVVGWAQGGDAGPRPKLAISEPTADLPPVVQGEKISHDFVVKNEGTAALKIDEVIPSCGCTVISFDKEIAPGATGKIHAEVDTSKLTGGSVKSLTVRTNDPENREVLLSLMVKVATEVEFNPGFARFVQGRGHPPGVIKQLFYAPTFPDLQIVSVDSPWPALKVEHREATEQERRKDVPGKQYVFTLSLDYDKAEIGPLSGRVEVTTNHPRQKTALLPVSGFVRPLLAVTPPFVDFGQLDLSQPAEARFKVANFGAKAMQVTAVEATLPGSETTFKVDEAGRSYFIEMKLSPTMPKGPFKGDLRIHTDSPAEPLVTVPLAGTVM